MPDWIKVAELSEIPPGETREVFAGDRVIALANVGGAVYALDGVCPHQGGPLGGGTLSGHVVTCPWHGWQFDVRSGRHTIIERLRQPCFAVRIEENGSIMVRLED